MEVRRQQGFRLLGPAGISVRTAREPDEEPARREATPSRRRDKAVEPVAGKPPQFRDESVEEIERFLRLGSEHELPEDVRFVPNAAAQGPRDRLALFEQVGSGEHHRLPVRLGDDPGQNAAVEAARDAAGEEVGQPCCSRRGEATSGSRLGSWMKISFMECGIVDVSPPTPRGYFRSLKTVSMARPAASRSIAFAGAASWFRAMT